MKLSTKVSVSITGVVAFAVLSSVGMLLSIRSGRDRMERIASENLPSVRAAEELEIALLVQKGYVSYYILDGGDPFWLADLARRKPEFAIWLARARATANTEEERQILAHLEEVYRQFDRQRDGVVALYDRGAAAEAAEALFGGMADLYERAYVLCEEFIATNERNVAARLDGGRRRVRRDMVLAGAFVGLTTASAAVLLWLFFHRIMRPLRRMAADARGAATPETGDASSPDDELRVVGNHLRELVSDVTEARTDLAWSRAQLMNSEKLASVGKLAASVAHEIRNPLTSLRMRLFWLQQQVGHDPLYEDEFRVVSEELVRLESVIRNFLEFSRPPDLRLADLTVSDLIDKTLELVGHRLVEKDIEVIREEGGEAGLVRADADQLKQVCINLILNAAEAMDDGGRIHICATRESRGPRRDAVVLRFRDTGPGVDREVQEHIFEPFYSTKEHGTGLGLCIAANIMARHGGGLDLEASGPGGTTFALWIPGAGGEDHG